MTAAKDVPKTMQPETLEPSQPRWAWLEVAIVGLAALVMGLPTLGGSFVGADDHRLVLNHVLVNHPSLDHAWQLIRIVHRDLYQPVPLLSFSAEFLVADWLGLFDRGVEQGAWLFHLSNICLHAINAVLVWAVVCSLRSRQDGPVNRWTPVVAGVLFAVHPLQVEVVAWVNGRMMLLSTLFAMLSVLALGRWMRSSRNRWAVLTAVAVLLCSVSKIRVGLPILLLIVPFALRQRYTWRFAGLWSVCCAIVGVLTMVNIQATADAGMFEGAVSNLQGPKPIRALVSLGWYFEHFVMPVGLASWYPTPVVVSWSDSATIRGIAVVFVSLSLMGWAGWRHRYAALGIVWFLATIASTVQLVQTRNALAADRYMYLPIVGLVWAVGVLFVHAGDGVASRLRATRWPWLAGSCLGGLAVALVGMSWHAASFYNSPAEKGRRIAELFPTVSHVWERVAWAYYHEKEYDEAISCARREFGLDDASAEGAAHQVIGMSLFRQGLQQEALAELDLAIQTDPKSSEALYNKGRLLVDLNRPEEALPWFERSIEDAPLANPRIIRLANLYRRLGRPARAREMYQRVLINNPYDPRATLSLAELDIEQDGREGCESAIARLEALLDWMPENTDARVNLGVAYNTLGRPDRAVQAYQQVLSEHPGHATAALNLAGLYSEHGEAEGASQYYMVAVRAGLSTFEQAATVHDFFIQQGNPQRAVDTWVSVLENGSGIGQARTFLAWSYVLAGDEVNALVELSRLSLAGQDTPLTTAATALIALSGGRPVEAAQLIEGLSGSGAGFADARKRLQKALAVRLVQSPSDPWPFCLAARLLAADQRLEDAAVFVDLCRQNCANAECEAMITSLQNRLARRAEP